MGKKKFEPEYKKEIIKLVTERGMKPGDVAKDIGVTPTSIRKWVKQYSEHGDNAFPGKGKLRPEDEEFRKLKRQIADLKEENKILKKAMAIFSRDER
jgi:transposase